MVNERQTEVQSPSENSDSVRDFEKENEFLRQNNKDLSLEVIGLKKKVSTLQQQIDTLHEEVFQLQYKNTNLKNFATKLGYDIRTKLLPNFTNFVNDCTNMLADTGFRKTPPNHQRQSIKTQAVQPQIVNGNVLYNPTITLRRFDDENRNTSANQFNPEPDNPPENVQIENETETSIPTTSEVPEERLNTIMEVNESSCLQNSQILTGEVRIFLNQIPLNQISNRSATDGRLSQSYSQRNAESMLSDSGNLPSCTPSFSMNLTKQTFRELGLSPTSSLATSTPYEPINHRESKLVNSTCFVTKTRGHRSKKVFSTSQDVNETVIAQNSSTPIQSSRKLVVQLESMNKENVELNNSVRVVTPKKPKNSRKKKSSTKPVEVKEEKLTPEPLSERPKRKAKPVNLKEPSLSKKLRRAK